MEAPVDIVLIEIRFTKSHHWLSYSLHTYEVPPLWLCEIRINRLNAAETRYPAYFVVRWEKLSVLGATFVTLLKYQQSDAATVENMLEKGNMWGKKLVSIPVCEELRPQGIIIA